MKFGIDINNSDISSGVLNELKSKGHYVIDMSVINCKKKGNELHGKSMLANSANIDFYISVFIGDIVDNPQIYYKEEEGTGMFCNMLLNKLTESSFEVVEFKYGEELYLIKNIQAPSVIIVLDINANKTMIKDSIVYCLLNGI